MKEQKKNSSQDLDFDSQKKQELFNEFQKFMDMLFPEQELFDVNSMHFGRLYYAFSLMRHVYPNMTEMDITKFCLDFGTTHKRDDWTPAEVRDCFINSVFGD